MESVSRERFRRADAVFDGALDLPLAERDAYVERACADDLELRAAVRELLRAHGRADGFLSGAAAELGAPLLGDPEPHPERVGPFRIVERIGRGGMGAVYLAERDDAQFRQRVALKLIRGGMASEPLVRHFLGERQILASLEHPHIARLLDGGVTAAGLPWFAMEHVDGVPIDRFCREGGLGVPERLALFRAVCSAVQYAHQRLVVHRDLKPSNILVTAEGMPKLLDFGIAKLLDPGAGPADAPRTRTALLALTPEYASPEQVRGDAVTTATDVYALGVVLYELLVGERPYDVRGRTPGEIERVVCDTTPRRPSASVPRLGGDLDTIVLQALQKDPERRYPSAAALLEDLTRYARGLPVLARPDSTAYRARKFVGRHRAGVAAAALLAGLLAASGFREVGLRRRAEASAQRAEVVQDYLVSVFQASDPFGRTPEPGQEPSARALLDRGAERVGAELGGEPDVQAELLGVLGTVYMNLGLNAEAAPLLERSLAQRRALHGEGDASVAEAMDALGRLYLAEGRYDEAEPLFRSALAQRRRLYGGEHADVAASLDRMATLLQERSDYDGAEPLFREALEMRRRLLGPQHPDVAESLNNLALIFWWRARYEGAEPLYREALAIRRASLGEEHPLTAQTLHNLAQVLQFRGRWDESESLFRQALAIKRRLVGDAHPTVTINLNNLGRLLRDRGEFEEAEALIREALALDRRMFGEDHPYVAASLTQLAGVMRARGSFGEAEAVYRQTLAMNRRLLGDEHQRVAQDLHSLGSVLHQGGDLEEAEALFREAAALHRNSLGPDHPFTIAATLGVANVLRERGDGVQAERLFRETVRHLEPRQPVARDLFIAAHVGLGRTLVAEGAPGRALEPLRAGLAMGRETFAAGDWRIAEAELALGECLTRLGRFAEAEPLLLHGREGLAAAAARQPRLTAQAEAAVAELYAAWGRPEGAPRSGAPPVRPDRAEATATP